MKKFILIQASVDQPSIEDDGIDGGLAFGLASPKLYDTLEEAQKAQMEFAEETLESMNECYGIGEEDVSIEGAIEDYSETNGDVEVAYYDDGYELNRTIVRIQEVEL